MPRTVYLSNQAFYSYGRLACVWISELAKTRKVTAVEMQGHGRTADIDRDMTYENLSDDVAGLLDYLKILRQSVSPTSLISS